MSRGPGSRCSPSKGSSPRMAWTSATSSGFPTSPRLQRRVRTSFAVLLAASKLTPRAINEWIMIPRMNGRRRPLVVHPESATLSGARLPFGLAAPARVVTLPGHRGSLPHVEKSRRNRPNRTISSGNSSRFGPETHKFTGDWVDFPRGAPVRSHRSVLMGGSSTDMSEARDLGSSLFRAGDVVEIVEVSRRQLQYWAQTDLIRPSAKTPGGHGRYTYEDLVALKAAKRLIDAGVSVQRIRKTIRSLRRTLPAVERPLSELIPRSDGRRAARLPGWDGLRCPLGSGVGVRGGCLPEGGRRLAARPARTADPEGAHGSHGR